MVWTAPTACAVAAPGRLISGCGSAATAVMAWLSAILAVKWMVAWLAERGLGIFGWWRLLGAALVTVLALTGHLS
jgi:undecaprenyl pyrophosphate phosphatase UppP